MPQLRQYEIFLFDFTQAKVVMAQVSKKVSCGLSFSYSLGCDGLFKTVNSPETTKGNNCSMEQNIYRYISFDITIKHPSISSK